MWCCTCLCSKEAVFNRFAAPSLLPLQPPPLAAALGRELRKALEKKAEAERARALAA